ncbi:MAG: hypothetical protein ABW321_00885, partial [Polyangiales bacterium]
MVNHGLIRRFWGLGLAGWLALGCAAPKQQRSRVVVHAESDPGQPLAGVMLGHEDGKAGPSDAAGKIALDLQGPLGEWVVLRVLCPSGYQASEPGLRVVLRPFAQAQHAPEYHVRCRPERRTLVVSIRAKNAVGVPVVYLGKTIGRTDRDGVAHGLLELAEGEQARLVLDTHATEHRYLRPQNPVLQVSMPDHDDVLSLEQPFVVDAPKKRP